MKYLQRILHRVAVAIHAPRAAGSLRLASLGGNANRGTTFASRSRRAAPARLGYEFAQVVVSQSAAMNGIGLQGIRIGIIRIFQPT